MINKQIFKSSLSGCFLAFLSLSTYPTHASVWSSVKSLVTNSFSSSKEFQYFTSDQGVHKFQIGENGVCLLIEDTNSQGNRLVFKDNGEKKVVTDIAIGGFPFFQYGIGAEVCGEKVMTDSIYNSPMIDPAGLQAEVDYINSDSQIALEIDKVSLCLTAVDLAERDIPILQICPKSFKNDEKTVEFKQFEVEKVYGLGQKFVKPNSPNGDWISHGERVPGDFGNVMEGFDGGLTGNTQFPIFYGFRPNQNSYALFLDHIYKQYWKIGTNKSELRTRGDAVRFTLFMDHSLLELRKKYMRLVGKAPVPPRKAFGLWVSEYGFDDWSELDQKLESLKKNQFPLDGFVMDLQWFGGITPNSPDSNMGSLTWDEQNFPYYKEKIQRLAEDHIELILIEEPYVAENLEEFAALKERGFLVKNQSGEPTILNSNPWWGRGSMIDYSNPEAGDFFFDYRRLDLIGDGIFGHWTDLGEPEIYDPEGLYHGIDGMEGDTTRHQDNHNLYNYLWHKSIYDGYVRHGIDKRLFLMSRSGAPGIQKFGASMWSGDIGARLSSLATHMNAQMHLSFSGIDYYGSDIGGFHRGAAQEDINEVYTRWFANSAWVDVPVRPHTENLCNCKETSPDLIGDIESNLYNIRNRYRLIPYYYSLAHKISETGAPLMAPLVMHFQEDPIVADIADQKMIGEDLMVVTETRSKSLYKDVYLPKGDWFDYRTGAFLSSEGGWLKSVPLYEDGIFRLPVFVKAGGILPTMAVDGATDAFGAFEVTKEEKGIEIFQGPAPTEFLVVEDDGRTNAYKSGDKNVLKIRQEILDSTVEISVDQIEGRSKVGVRHHRVRYHSKGLLANAVKVNGIELIQVANAQALDGLETGWSVDAYGVVELKTGGQLLSDGLRVSISFDSEKAQPPFAYFVCANSSLKEKEEIRIVGNIPMLGNWDAGRGLVLGQTPHNSAVELVKNLPVDKKVEWKCVKDFGNGTYAWQGGANNVFDTGKTGYIGVQNGSL